MNNIIFSADDRIGYTSYVDGYSLGKRYYSRRNDLPLEKMLRIANQLMVKPERYRIAAYRIGFLYGYYSGNPVTTKMLDELAKGDLQMGAIAKAKKQNQSFNGYLKPQQLAEIEAVFCIRVISRSNGAYGEQWSLIIQVSDEDSLLLDMGDFRSATLQFGIGKKETNKDLMLKELQSQTPVHCATLKIIPLRNGNTYIDLDEVTNVSCPCGVTLDEEEFSDDELSNNHPF